MTGTWDRHTAGLIVEEALAAVFEADAVKTLREDSPLHAVGLTLADLVCLADAIADASSKRGWLCVLGDADLGDAATVSDLIEAVMAMDPEGATS